MPDGSENAPSGNDSRQSFAMNRLQTTFKSALVSHRLQAILQETYYKSVPDPIRAAIDGRDRAFVFHEAMKTYLKDPGVCTQPGNSVLKDLIYGWGNEAWGAKEEFLVGCISHTLKSPGSILECGSGLSTVLLAVIAKKLGQHHWVLEHKPEWASKVQNYLDKYSLDSLIIVKPLKNYGDFCWYDAQIEGVCPRFSIVVCDGPPSRTKGGRYGLIPVMKAKLNPICTIFLDDGGRKDELEIAKRWAIELDTSFSIHGTTKPYIRMDVGSNQA